MLYYVSDLLFTIVVLITAYYISRRGMVNAAVLFIAMLIASLLAITTFEPVANWISRTYLVATDFRVASWIYIVSVSAIFSSALALQMWCIHLILPEAPVMSQRMESIGARVLGVLGGYLFASFLLTALLTSPAPREFWGTFAPEAHRRPGPIMACAPDYQFLALTEYTCEHAFALTGGSWGLGRPVISAETTGGRWSTFPIRYSRFRENP